MTAEGVTEHKPGYVGIVAPIAGETVEMGDDISKRQPDTHIHQHMERLMICGRTGATYQLGPIRIWLDRLLYSLSHLDLSGRYTILSLL
jgi:hypothetical protein